MTTSSSSYADRIAEGRALAAARQREDAMLRELPALEAEAAAEQRRAQRQRQREAALAKAREGMALVRQRQASVPAAVTAAREAVAAAVRTIAAVREAEEAVMAALLTADDLSFWEELEAAQAEARVRGRDERAALYATRPRPDNGREWARRLLEGMAPDYDLFAGVPRERGDYRRLIVFLREQLS